MGTLRRCVVLCWWGAILLTVRGAPITDQSDDLLMKDTKDIETSFKISSDRKQRDIIPCFSTLKGYGLCDDYLFTLNPIYSNKQELVYGLPTEHVNIQHKQPVFNVDGGIRHQYSYPYTNKAFAFPDIIPQSIVADQFIAIITPITKYPKDASKGQKFPIIPPKSTPPQSYEVSPPNVQEVHSALEVIFQTMSDISRNVTKALMEGENLQSKINRTGALPAYESNEAFSYLDNLKNVFQRIEKLAENITNVTSALIEFQRKIDSVVLNSNEKTPESGKDKHKPSFQEETDSKYHGDSNLSNDDQFDRIASKIDKLDSDVKTLGVEVHNLDNNLSKGSDSEQTSPSGPGEPTFADVLKKTGDITEELKNVVQFIEKVRSDIENGFRKMLQGKGQTNLIVSDETKDKSKGQTNLSVSDETKDKSKGQTNLTVSDETKDKSKGQTNLTVSDETKDKSKGETNLTVNDETGETMKDTRKLKVNDKINPQRVPENLIREKREIDRGKDEGFSEASDEVNIIADDKFDSDSVLAILERVEQLFAGVNRVEDFDKAMAKVFSKNIFNEGIQKREINGDIVKVPVRKTDLYDIMKKAFKSRTFDEFFVDAYLKKASELVRNGVEPFDILVDTLSNILLLSIQRIQDARIERLGKKVPNKELYELIKDTFETNSTDWLDVYVEKFDNIQRKGVEPLHLLVDFTGDLYFVVYEKMQEKDSDDTEKDYNM